MRNHINKLFLLVGMVLLSLGASAQEKVTVTGNVVDVNGEPIIGASVLEAGTTNGTITDFDGNFKIQVKPKATLRFSYVGFETQSIRVNGQKTINLTLLEDRQMMEEVVVVGYGHQKKESVVGAISQVNTKELLKSPAGNVSQALAGKVPGLVTTQTSGAPGADDMKLYIRGQASFAGDNQPLIMVDGIERPFSQIAPDDIENISVLKDASATAVYGVRGANGVILITTKRGKDQKPTVSLTANWQWSTPTRKDTYLNSYESVKLLEEALANDGLPSQYSAADIDMFRKSVRGELSGVEALLYPNVDWYDTVLRKSAPAQRYNVNIQGGTKRMRYYVSAEYYDQQGLFKNFSQDQYGNKSNQSYNRVGFRANLDFDMTKDLTLSVNFGTRFEERKGPNSNEAFDGSYSQIFYGLNHMPGWLFPVSYQLDNGDGTSQSLFAGTAQYPDNPVGRLARAGFYRATNTINETNFIVNYKMDWITPGLSAKGMLSFDYNSYYNRKFTANFATYELLNKLQPNDIDSYSNNGTANTELTYAGDDQTSTYKLYMEFQLNYARKFGKHDITAMLLYNQNDYRYQAELAKRYQGLVGRMTYGYDDRYLAEVNFGYNGSENFRSGKRFGFFPSFSLGWIISNEKFMEKTKKWLDNLKIRASYGQVGNDVYLLNGVQQRFLYEEQWWQYANAYHFGSNSVTTIYEGRYPNYNVTWERAHKFNAGIDFALFNGLIRGNFDMFYERRNDILTAYLSRPDWAVGSKDWQAAGNLGKTKNSGFELDLRHTNTIGKNFRYNVGFSFSHAKNEIIEMDEPALKTAYRVQAGHPIGQFIGLISEGFVTQADIDGGNLPVSTYGTVKVGDLKYKDMNGDGFIDDRDQTYIGNSNIPENTYSLSLGCEWKGISFSMMFQAVDHVSRYYDNEAMFAFVGGGKVKEHHLQRWNPNESEAYNLANATYPLLHYDAYGNHNQQCNSFFLKNGSFIRLKNIELGYNLPSQWIKHLAMTECRVFVNANNLITWDHLDDLVDPESSGSNKYPIMKTVNVGLNIRF
jgi:TonB-linked SusC/RagA family outer membrane protein